MTITDTPRGVCDVCGKPAYAPQAKKCDEHKSKGKAASRMTAVDDAIRRATSDAPESDISRMQPPQSPEPKGEGQSKSDRARYYEGYIRKEINPLLAQGLAFVCQPVPSINFYREEGDNIVPNNFGERAAFAKPEAWLLSRAVAELEGNPMLTTVGKSAAPILPFLLAGGCVFVLGAKAYGLWSLREQIVKKWETENNPPQPGQEAHTAAAEAAQAAEADRVAAQPTQAPTMSEAEAAEAVRQAAAHDEASRMGYGNATKAEVADIDLGTPGEAALDPSELPNVVGAQEAELADLLSGA